VRVERYNPEMLDDNALNIYTDVDQTGPTWGDVVGIGILQFFI